MIAVGMITVVESGRARVTLLEPGVQTPPLKTLDGRTWTAEDVGKAVLVGSWSGCVADSAILGVLT